MKLSHLFQLYFPQHSCVYLIEGTPTVNTNYYEMNFTTRKLQLKNFRLFYEQGSKHMICSMYV